MPKFLVLRYPAGGGHRLMLAPLRHAAMPNDGAEVVGTLQLPIGVRLEDGNPLVLVLPRSGRVPLPQVVTGGCRVPGVSFVPEKGE
jgi:hypothetical protein